MMRNSPNRGTSRFPRFPETPVTITVAAGLVITWVGCPAAEHPRRRAVLRVPQELPRAEVRNTRHSVGRRRFPNRLQLVLQLLLLQGLDD